MLLLNTLIQPTIWWLQMLILPSRVPNFVLGNFTLLYSSPETNEFLQLKVEHKIINIKQMETI